MKRTRMARTVLTLGIVVVLLVVLVVVVAILDARQLTPG